MYDCVGAVEVAFVGVGLEDVGASPGDLLRPGRGGLVGGDGGPVWFAGAAVQIRVSICWFYKGMEKQCTRKIRSSCLPYTRNIPIPCYSSFAYSAAQEAIAATYDQSLFSCVGTHCIVCRGFDGTRNLTARRKLSRISFLTSPRRQFG